MWKIEKITFKNFARIKSGTGRSVLTLDLSKFTNAVTLFVGANGTGKSAILRSLHPFAYNTNSGDSLSNSELICAGCNGEKIIDISCNDDMYHIEHIYNRQKDKAISLKSYISINGKELNSSGTVTTFKSIIKQYLGLDETFLTLLSLGDSVKGFVDYKSSDRKKYASKIFSELHVYDDYYKTITNEVRHLKSIMSNVSFKLNKYNGIDIDDLKSNVDQLNTKINILKDKYRAININIGELKANIDNNSEFIKNYTEIRDRYLSNIDNRKLIKSKIPSEYSNETIDTIGMRLSDVSYDIVSLEKSNESLKVTIKSNLDQIDMIKTNLDQVIGNLSNISDNTTVDELISLKNKLESDANEVSAIINNTNIKNIEKLNIDYLISLQVKLTDISRKCYDLLLINPNKEFIIDLYNKFLTDNKLYKNTVDSYNNIGNSIENYNVIYKNKIIMDRVIDHDCTDKNCPYKQFYLDYIKIMNQSMSKTTKELDAKYDKMNKLNDVIKIMDIFKSIIKLLDDYSINENTVPTDIFDIKNCISSGLTNPDGLIHNDQRLIQYIDLLENIKKLNSLKEKISETNNRIGYISSNMTIKSNLESMVTEYNGKLNELDKQTILFNKTVLDNDKKLSNLYTLRDDMVNTMNYLNDIAILTNDIDNDKSILDSMYDKKQDINKLNDKLSSLNDECAIILKDIRSYETDRETKLTIINDIESLIKEEESIREDYDIAIDIQEAVSPIKGIPTEFIENYIKGKIIPSINELLYSVYQGRLQILPDKVIVNSDQFTIPYKTRTDVVNDISNASDGERAMISLAFSLTLTKLLMVTNSDDIHYNIMLLDEMDRALDVSGRSRYIELIEYYISTIKAKQIFISSHNNMFDNYPVNVIRTSDGKIPSVNDNNLIDLA